MRLPLQGGGQGKRALDEAHVPVAGRRDRLGTHQAEPCLPRHGGRFGVSFGESGGGLVVCADPTPAPLGQEDRAGFHSLDEHRGADRKHVDEHHADHARVGAGAARAAVLGPEATRAQLDRLVSAGLTQQVISETLSGSVLFPNDSATLLPGASAELIPLLAQLRRLGATGVVNGFASTPGSASRNYALSEARAAEVASFFESRGVSPFSLLVVGHGATDLVAPGPSAANRRVVIVIEEPSGAQF
jgi:outer membrane protein OmpA-like peptidoglycan-associated protein